MVFIVSWRPLCQLHLYYHHTASVISPLLDFCILFFPQDNGANIYSMWEIPKIDVSNGFDFDFDCV